MSNELIPPSDLIDLQRAVDSADAARTAAYRRQPSATAVLAGDAQITDDMRAATRVADSELAALARQKFNHSWWGDVPNWAAAEAALRKAALDETA